MSYLFNTYLYIPLYNALIYLYDKASWGDLGIAIIVLTILVRIVLYPFFYKGAKDQAIMQKIAPKLKEIQTKLKDDKQKQVEQMMALYKEHKVNPFSAFFLLLVVQLPILFAMFKVFTTGLKTMPQDILYAFVPHVETLNYSFLGIMDLSQKNMLLIVLTAVAQYYQAKLTLPKSNKAFKDLEMAEMMGRQMMYMGPILTVVVLLAMPSAIALYWLTTTLFSIGQQVIINKKINIVKDHGKLTVAE
ncbi:MAG: Membrane protein insertase, YidC/Oxa1 family [Candidatus Wolfebacteria bacterium GW2011_GWE1_48_7]|uniref:Membrane protein insertase, YidC/Oxa1 family n=2 Tax=Candidatus Wolfeibacteriota TaxID=1752735 RepID=A0A0G1U4L2_9BACT|nr:MAG: putative 60 kDa inner membrane insertion protein [Candidatus Wolfebacteria bacterium GW2011_GWB1_47_1]KKU36307.1 MAG: Membrane protein insertase, YidC/Oxa1 family [Candidatus Wolfebacteria bacterium GW2011_GWC2_46_275]KKU41859.1 MAG: Membrane protein insertase, YidC/Oxa1 family [Candidatus Wolfebacteria bacterium GW2011_GWB2_46_69]KKU54136.1 MAG: Membrane protein insertase, YidC/Oxa1 family [Candidatus Wolfebacteria bacterium GW2011_GWC1_47_103]KKU59059.1 MAG: Membrane protein insertase